MAPTKQEEERDEEGRSEDKKQEEEDEEETDVDRLFRALKYDESCQGLLGVALNNTLTSLSNETLPILSRDQTRRILDTFGSAVASTCREQLHEPPTQQQHVDTAAATHQPPAAALRGRLVHSNQYGDKWRIVVENAKITRKKKRKRSTSQEDVIEIPRLEVLGFNDFD